MPGQFPHPLFPPGKPTTLVWKSSHRKYQNSVFFGSPPPPWFGSIRALNECVWLVAYRCALVCVFRSTNVRRMSVLSMEAETTFGLGALLWREKIQKEKKKTKNRHKWQMAILVALQCCSPLAYMKTFFFWFAPVELFCLVCPWK